MRRSQRLVRALPALLVVCAFSCKSGPEPIPPPAPPQASAAAPEPESSQPAYLGILYTNTSGGVMVLEVFPDSPASRAGIRPYDLIISANGYPVIGSFTLRERILSLKPYTQVDIEIRNRDGMSALRRVVLEPLPERFNQKQKEEAF